MLDVVLAPNLLLWEARIWPLVTLSLIRTYSCPRLFCIRMREDSVYSIDNTSSPCLLLWYLSPNGRHPLWRMIQYGTISVIYTVEVLSVVYAQCTCNQTKILFGPKSVLGNKCSCTVLPDHVLSYTFKNSTITTARIGPVLAMLKR